MPAKCREMLLTTGPEKCKRGDSTHVGQRRKLTNPVGLFDHLDRRSNASLANRTTARFGALPPLRLPYAATKSMPAMPLVLDPASRSLPCARISSHKRNMDGCYR